MLETSRHDKHDKRLQWKLVFGVGGVILVAAGLTAAVTAWTLGSTPLSSGSAIARLSVNVEQTPADTNNPLLALSPDGSLLAYVGRGNNTSQIYLTRLDGLETLEPRVHQIHFSLPAEASRVVVKERPDASARSH
jgi:hypothetical protein